MKKIEWLLAILLIIIGLACLIVPSVTVWGDGTIKSYVTTLIQICFWIGLPGLIIGVLYVMILSGRKNK